MHEKIQKDSNHKNTFIIINLQIISYKIYQSQIRYSCLHFCYDDVEIDSKTLSK